MKLEITFNVELRLGVPLVKIIVDDYLTLADGPAQDEYLFDINIPDETHELKIIHYGKTPDNHTHDANGNIIIDRHVEIKSISMDYIPLERELWEGKFFPVYMHKAEDEPYFICPNLYLGHNGTWQLEFATPVAKWLIAKRKAGPKLDKTIFKTNQEVLDSAKLFFKDLPDV